MEWYLIVALICTSLVTCDVELHMFILQQYIFFELFIYFAHFQILGFYPLSLSFKSLCIL